MTHIKLYMQAGLDSGCVFKQRTLRLMTLVTVAIAPGIWQPQPGWLGKIKHHGNEWNTFFSFFPPLRSAALLNRFGYFPFRWNTGSGVYAHRLTPTHCFNTKSSCRQWALTPRWMSGLCLCCFTIRYLCHNGAIRKKTIRHVLIFL